VWRCQTKWVWAAKEGFALLVIQAVTGGLDVAPNANRSLRRRQPIFARLHDAQKTAETDSTTKPYAVVVKLFRQPLPILGKGNL